MTYALQPSDEVLIDLALAEDLGHPFADITSQTLFKDQGLIGQYEVVSKHSEAITIAGLPLVAKILDKVCDSYQLNCKVQDGAQLMPGESLLSITAPCFKVVMVERLILNFLRHLSAIATLTQRYVQQIQHVGSHTKVLDTRKTTPGQRLLEKYAVRCGGGENHRLGLYDAIMVKDTHVDQLGGMAATIKQLPLLADNPYPVIVEVRDTGELQVILQQGLAKVNRVLLDNMPCAMLQESVRLCRGKLATEASGGINLQTIGEIAKTGVDFASVGELTYGAGQVDLSMRSVNSG